jgi:hypothetical protein
MGAAADFAVHRRNQKALPDTVPPAWRAVVIEAPEKADDYVTVRAVNTASGGEYSIGSSSWPSPNNKELPEAGDECIVLLDETRDPWIVAWVDNWAGGERGPIPWHSAPLINSWVAFGAPYANPQYLRDPLGWVHMRGGIKGGLSGVTAFKLPSSYRPASVEVLPIIQNNGEASGVYIIVEPNGNVIPIGPEVKEFTGLNCPPFMAANSEGHSWLQGAPGPVGPGGTVTRIATTLPKEPNDGDEVDYEAAPGVVWRLRYNASAVSASKWQCVGGDEVMVLAANAPQNTVSGGASSNTVIPFVDFSVPFNGVYDVAVASTMVLRAGGGTQITTFTVLTAAGNIAGTVGYAGLNSLSETYYAPHHVADRTTALTAGTVIKPGFQSSTASVSIDHFNVYLRVKPVFVGP